MMLGRCFAVWGRTCLLLLGIASRVCTPQGALALGVESLLMPGEVTAKHARVERECKKCHDPFDKAAQNPLCLSCHKDVAADIGDTRGYHGQDPAVRGRACRTCHAEHKGRAADLVHLDRERFDHRLTDRPLRGGHLHARCDDCHTAGKRYREAPSRCNDCHGRKDPHEASLGEACDSCHAETAWKAVRFDHDTAGFRLDGRHHGARCEGCHKTKRFKPTASDCYACHERNDKHRGSFGRACQSCHTTRAFAGTTFDHARKTQFPLLSRHARTACGSCHKDALAAASTPTTCPGCHERDDAHHGQFGRTCETCHVPTEWRRPTFEHDRNTRFQLRGRHREVRCTECHRGTLHVERLDTGCNGCHREDDVHHGRQGPRCDKCHDERGWSRDVLVDHAATDFPLTGAHTRVACMRCHTSAVFKNVAHECVSCHERDAVHRCQRGAQCERCHETTTFRVVRAP